jgi:transcriptional antiterminator RfaH
MTDRPSAWYVVQSKPSDELRAAANLATLHIGVFLPLASTDADDVGRRRRSIFPLFPQNLFVHCNMEAMSRKISGTRGVARVLGTGLGPTAVDDSIIALVRSRCDEDGVVRLKPRYTRGDLVRVTGGPFRDWRGVFESYTTPADRVAVLLATFNSTIRVVVTSDQLQPFKGGASD